MKRLKKAIVAVSIGAALLTGCAANAGGDQEDNDRFECVHCDTWRFCIYKDKVTGVHYLVYKHDYGSGITPLLDENGRVVVRK